MTQPAALRAIAHDSLCLTESPYLKHYKDGRFRSWKGVGLTASELPGPGFNFAAVLHPGAPTFDELMPVAREFFTGCSEGWGILVEGDSGHPMEAELLSRGWKIAEDEPAFVVEPIEPSETVSSPPDLAIRVVRTQTDADSYCAITGEAFQAPPEMAEKMLPSLDFVLDPDIAIFVGAVAGTDVTAVGYSRSGSTAVLWGTATLEARRGRGYGASVTRAALAHAASHGCTSAALRSGRLSIPLYERIGFRYVCQHRTYAFPGGE